MKRIMVLGATGMLGSAVHGVLAKNANFLVQGTARIPGENFIEFDPSRSNVTDFLSENDCDWIVNCIGIIKPRIDEKSRASVLNAVDINSRFPANLAEASEKIGARVIQIATDCVYSGERGLYDENDPHDPTDVYGKTKSLGEIVSNSVLHLRASIIGPEVGRSTSLLEWFRGQAKNAKVNGFKDHLWNGITTYQFGRLCEGLISQNISISGVRHVIPRDIVTKLELLNILQASYSRQDITINETLSSKRIDRTLKTNFPDFNNEIWFHAGYSSTPTISEMVEEQALKQD